MVIHKLPDVRVYTWGEIKEFDAWAIQLTNKLTADSAVFSKDGDNVRYTFSRLEGKALDVAIRTLEGAGGTVEAGFTSLTVNRLLHLLKLAHIRRETIGRYDINKKLGTARLHEDAPTTITVIRKQTADDTAQKDMLLESMRYRDATIWEWGCELIEREPRLDLDAFAKRYLAVYRQNHPFS